MIKNIKFFKSNRKNKKYKVQFKLFNNLYTIHFGDIRYQHYKDQTNIKLYTHLDHLDKKRRKNYLSRSKGIKNKKNELTKDNPLSSNYWSIRYLW